MNQKRIDASPDVFNDEILEDFHHAGLDIHGHMRQVNPVRVCHLARMKIGRLFQFRKPLIEGSAMASFGSDLMQVYGRRFGVRAVDFPLVEFQHGGINTELFRGDPEKLLLELLPC